MKHIMLELNIIYSNPKNNLKYYNNNLVITKISNNFVTRYKVKMKKNTICPKCKINKKQISKNGNLAIYCKECYVVYKKEYHSRPGNREKAIGYYNKCVYKNNQLLFDFKNYKKECEICGKTKKENNDNNSYNNISYLMKIIIKMFTTSILKLERKGLLFGFSKDHDYFYCFSENSYW